MAECLRTKRRRRLKHALISVRSAPPAGDDGSLTLEGTLQDPDDRIASAADKIALGEALRTLPALRREIIFLRYYKNMSQQQTGEKLGISQVKVSREEKKILEQLRAVL